MIDDELNVFEFWGRSSNAVLMPKKLMPRVQDKILLQHSTNFFQQKKVKKIAN